MANGVAGQTGRSAVQRVVAAFTGGHVLAIIPPPNMMDSPVWAKTFRTALAVSTPVHVSLSTLEMTSLQSCCCIINEYGTHMFSFCFFLFFILLFEFNFYVKIQAPLERHGRCCELVSLNTMIKISLSQSTVSFR